MKKIKLALGIFSLFLSQAQGSQPGDEIAAQLVADSKIRMIETGVLTPLQLQEFDERGNRIATQLKAAYERSDEAAIEKGHLELKNYASEYERLEILRKSREKENKVH